MAGESEFRLRLVSAPGGVYAGRQSIFKVKMLWGAAAALMRPFPGEQSYQHVAGGRRHKGALKKKAEGGGSTPSAVVGVLPLWALVSAWHSLNGDMAATRVGILYPRRFRLARRKRKPAPGSLAVMLRQALFWPLNGAISVFLGRSPDSPSPPAGQNAACEGRGVPVFFRRIAAPLEFGHYCLSL